MTGAHPTAGSSVHPLHDFLGLGAARAIAVGGVTEVGIAERDTQQHQAILGDAEVFADQRSVRGERRLRDSPQAEALCGEQESADIEAGIDGSVDVCVPRISSTALTSRVAVSAVQP